MCKAIYTRLRSELMDIKRLKQNKQAESRSHHARDESLWAIMVAITLVISYETKENFIAEAIMSIIMPVINLNIKPRIVFGFFMPVITSVITPKEFIMPVITGMTSPKEFITPVTTSKLKNIL